MADERRKRVRFFTGQGKSPGTQVDLFIRIWSGASCAQDVAEKTGMCKQSCFNYAVIFRKLGIRMKKFNDPKKGERLDPTG